MLEPEPGQEGGHKSREMARLPSQVVIVLWLLVCLGGWTVQALEEEAEAQCGYVMPLEELPAHFRVFFVCLQMPCVFSAPLTVLPSFMIHFSPFRSGLHACILDLLACAL